jgi:hypothetical protein
MVSRLVNAPYQCAMTVQRNQTTNSLSTADAQTPQQITQTARPTYNISTNQLSAPRSSSLNLTKERTSFPSSIATAAPLVARQETKKLALLHPFSLPPTAMARKQTPRSDQAAVRHECTNRQKPLQSIKPYAKAHLSCRPCYHSSSSFTGTEPSGAQAGGQAGGRSGTQGARRSQLKLS